MAGGTTEPITVNVLEARPADAQKTERRAGPGLVVRSIFHLHAARPPVAVAEGRVWIAPPLYRTLALQRAPAGFTDSETDISFPWTTRCAPPVKWSPSGRL